jgi:hypothetical protein
VRLIQLVAVVGFGVGVLTAGCYALQPASGVTPEVGSEMAFDVNDAGRVALGGSMGPSIQQVTGRLISKDGEDYVVAVSNVEILGGGNQAWRGEVVRINTSYVSAVYRRTFSKVRTVAFVGVVAGAVALVAGKALAAGHVDPDSFLPDTNPQRRGRRPPRPFHPPFLRSFNPPRSF